MLTKPIHQVARECRKVVQDRNLKSDTIQKNYARIANLPFEEAVKHAGHREAALHVRWPVSDDAAQKLAALLEETAATEILWRVLPDTRRQSIAFSLFKDA